MSDPDTYGRRAQPARLDTPYPVGPEAQISKLRQAMQAADRPARSETEPSPGNGHGVDQIAIWVRWLSLKDAMDMAAEIVGLPDYKPPQTKIELAMLLNDWAQTKA